METFHKLFLDFKNNITSKIWIQICSPRIRNLTVLISTKWPLFTARLVSLVTSVKELKISCNEGCRLLSTGLARKDLKTLVQGLNLCKLGNFFDVDDWVEKVINKVLVFKSLKNVSEDAQILIAIKRKMELTGDFSVVEEIAEVSCWNSLSKFH